MAIFTVPGKDIIRITEDDYFSNIPKPLSKVHIIRLDFITPDDEKMEWVINKFYQTNRYVIDIKNIKYYNYYLKRTNLKYYIINTNNSWKGLVSFYKRNNKVLLDFTKLSKEEKKFVLNESLNDVLYNTEVILINKQDYLDYHDCIDEWRGNCIINDVDYLI